MTMVSCHHKPTPIINKLELAAKDQTKIYCSLQINKSIAIHCESQCSSVWERAGVSDWLYHTSEASSVALKLSVHPGPADHSPNPRAMLGLEVHR